MQGLGDTYRRVEECLVDLDARCVEEAVEEALGRGASATELVLGPMSRAMDEIGRLYEEGEYFIAELLEAAEIFKGVMVRLEPLLAEEAARGAGASRRDVVVVLGTVKGDIHDIGKTLVKIMLQAAGFRVVDLGVDVPAERFADAVEETGARVVGMSALLTTTMRYMGRVIEELERGGLRDRVYVVIGGAPTTPEYAERIGANAWARDAIEAVKVVSRLVEAR
ncbi:MAG: corrinoid protein [Candidatus Korarchaeota archaeon]|nr:corrinoid protein [Candidatus Korarchaeota archaeon]